MGMPQKLGGSESFQFTLEVIPMSKRKYRAMDVNEVDVVAVAEAVGEARLVVAVDVARDEFFAGLQDGSYRVHATVKWKHPTQSWAFLKLLEDLRSRGVRVEVAMEPSGTYGDALRVKALERGFPVFRVSPKRSHDAAEVYDGVPSLHDAKSAAIIGKLHIDGASEAWPLDAEEERALAAALRLLELHQKEYQRNRNRLEALLARHWPELSLILELGSATLLELLLAFGGPAGVARDPAGAKQLMRRVGRSLLEAGKIDQVIESAGQTFGAPQIQEERRTLQAIAAEARRAQKESHKAKQRVERLTQASTGAKHLAPVVGKTTAAVLVAGVGEPQRYKSPKAYQKALGLNLREKSSGKHKGGLHLTKRGPAVARLFLYLAVLRLIQSDPVIRAWYAKKVRRMGGEMKSKAVVAIMRKLALALWHVAGGSAFDSTRLFDVSRLELGPAATTKAKKAPSAPLNV